MAETTHQQYLKLHRCSTQVKGSNSPPFTGGKLYVLKKGGGEHLTLNLSANVDSPTPALLQFLGPSSSQLCDLDGRTQGSQWSAEDRLGPARPGQSLV